MRYAPAVVVWLVLGIGSTAFGGPNPNVTLPLHARPTSGSCVQFAPVDCLGGGVRPTVNVSPSTDYVIYLLVMNYTQLAGVQTAFDWDASWVLNDVLFNCRQGQVNATLPDPSQPGGATTGTAASAFTLINGPALAAIGRLNFTAGTQGCVSQVQSSLPFGVHVTRGEDPQNDVDMINADDPVQQTRLGKICVTDGGRDSCDPFTPAVEPSSWGSIKATFTN